MPFTVGLIKSNSANAGLTKAADTIAHILRERSASKVREFVVGLNSVFMVYLQSFRHWAAKRFVYQSINCYFFNASSYTRRDIASSVAYSWMKNAAFATNVAYVTGEISRERWARFPDFFHSVLYTTNRRFAT